MKTAILCLLLCVLSGCAARGPAASYAGALPEKNVVALIAADAVDVLADLYPPGHTALHILPAKDAENAFALALESGLRAKGFMLASRVDAVFVMYTLDGLEEQSAWYLRLGLSDGKSVRVMARVYDALGRPEAGQSRMFLDAGRAP